MEFDLKKLLKALLSSTSEFLSIKEIQSVIAQWRDQQEEARKSAQEEGVEGGGQFEQSMIEDILSQVPVLLTATQIREALEEMRQELKDSGSATRLQIGPEGFRLVIAPEYADLIRLLRNEPRPQKLTQAALETLAIVAYRQPVTRAEMEALRGVNSDTALSRLIDLELVAVSGRADLPGRPSQFSTTPKFLEFIGLKTLSELPESDVLSPAQIAEWMQKAMNPVKPTNGDLGFAGKDDPAPTASLALDGPSGEES